MRHTIVMVVGGWFVFMALSMFCTPQVLAQAVSPRRDPAMIREIKRQLTDMRKVAKPLDVESLKKVVALGFGGLQGSSQLSVDVDEACGSTYDPATDIVTIQGSGGFDMGVVCGGSAGGFEVSNDACSVRGQCYKAECPAGVNPGTQCFELCCGEDQAYLHGVWSSHGTEDENCDQGEEATETPADNVQFDHYEANGCVYQCFDMVDGMIDGTGVEKCLADANKVYQDKRRIINNAVGNCVSDNEGTATDQNGALLSVSMIEALCESGAAHFRGDILAEFHNAEANCNVGFMSVCD